MTAPLWAIDIEHAFTRAIRFVNNLLPNTPQSLESQVRSPKLHIVSRIFFVSKSVTFYGHPAMSAP
jgi:hypothetical protein